MSRSSATLSNFKFCKLQIMDKLQSNLYSFKPGFGTSVNTPIQIYIVVCLMDWPEKLAELE